jgi:hypothetical protein
MVFRILRPARHVAWLALVVACGVSSACSSSKPAVPDAFVQATVGPGANGTACNQNATITNWLDIGTPVAGKPTTQGDGSNQAGSTIHVSCTVATSGSGFDVELSATQEGLNGGSLIITSPQGQGAVTQSGGTGLTGVFENGSYGDYTSSNCTISFTYQGSPVPDQPPLAAGRIWGHISCPNASQAGKTVTGGDGGAETVQCDTEADFLFEQCGQ